MKLLVDEKDVNFVLHEQLRIEELCKYPKYSSFSRDLFDMAFQEAEKLASKEFLISNRDGDRQGCRFEAGKVKVPDSFHKPYQRYCEGGWLAMSDPPEVGGQGFPFVVSNACIELFGAANWSLLMYAGLTHGSARLLEEFGTPEQQELYMYKLFSGEWAGTMCLTEPQAGSDVGSLTTKATPIEDGAYLISGQKIFISAGMHDLTENIVHMVLARVDGAPKGVRGISIFIVPRMRYGDDGSLMDNDVTCTGIEHKLGISGSATCSLSFGENGRCVGYLLGQEHAGMRIMFEMMNEARLFVGMQGLALASTAYLHALNFAKERLQGTSAERMKDPTAPRVPIIHHPDVRRMLMFMKSSTEGMRALLYLAAYCIDRVRAAQSEEERERFQGHVDLLIPICKSVGSDLGFRVCETAIQVYGGYGYISEFPVEQFLRDCKIASIYEGTNGIQALDLVGRKLTQKRGKLVKNALAAITEILDRIRTNFNLRELVGIYEEAQESVIQVTKFFALKGMTDEFQAPLLHAKPYLDLCGDTTMGFLLLWQAHLADRRLQEIYRDHRATDAKTQQEVLKNNRSAAFYHGKIASARFFINQVLTQANGRARAIMNNDQSALEISEHGFCLG
jgi:alkylation response protein AidB-like acyl-CoA dehydrogenase